MSQTFVQVKANTVSSGSSFSLTNVTTQLGNTLVVSVSWFTITQPAPTISDSAGNTYNQVGSTVTNGSVLSSAVFIATNTTGNSSGTVTATWKTSVNFIGLEMVEYKNVGGAGAAVTSTGSSGVPPSTANLTVPTGGGIFTQCSQSGAHTQIAGTNFTFRVTNGGDNIEDWLNASTGSQTVAFGNNATNVWVMSAFILNPPSSGAGGGTTNDPWLSPWISNSLRGVRH